MGLRLWLNGNVVVVVSIVVVFFERNELKGKLGSSFDIIQKGYTIH
jgi:hypothetical protein